MMPPLSSPKDGPPQSLGGTPMTLSLERWRATRTVAYGLQEEEDERGTP
jgi:hypothetical protein